MSNIPLISGSYCISKVSPDTNASLGIEVLKSQGFFPGSYWYWIGVGALIGITFLFNSCYILALTYLNRECYELLCYFSILLTIPQIIWCHVFAALGRPQTIRPEDENEVKTEKNGE